MIDGEDRGETPTTLTLDRGEDHQLIVQKEGYDEQTINLNHEMTMGWPIVGNIFSWSLLGIIVDVANGAAYQLTPQQVEAALGDSQAAQLREKMQGDGIHVVLLTSNQIQGTIDLSNAVRVN